MENGKTAYVNFLDDGEIACGSTEFIVLRGKDVSGEFVYLLARTHAFRENAIKSMVGSSGRQRVQESCFEKFPVLKPPHLIMKAFDDMVSPIFKLIGMLQLKNRKLRKARDILLPKLMGGVLKI